MLNWLRRLLCRHQDMDFEYNLYGDQINAHAGMRSVWRCKCGREVWKGELHGG